MSALFGALLVAAAGVALCATALAFASGSERVGLSSTTLGPALAIGVAIYVMSFALLARTRSVRSTWRRAFVAAGLVTLATPLAAMASSAAAQVGQTSPIASPGQLALAVRLAVSGGSALVVVGTASFAVALIFLAIGWAIGRGYVEPDWLPRARTVCPNCTEAVIATGPSCSWCGHDFTALSGAPTNV